MTKTTEPTNTAPHGPVPGTRPGEFGPTQLIAALRAQVSDRGPNQTADPDYVTWGPGNRRVPGCIIGGAFTHLTGHLVPEDREGQGVTDQWEDGTPVFPELTEEARAIGQAAQQAQDESLTWREALEAAEYEATRLGWL